jgi:hypothetical protein
VQQEGATRLVVVGQEQADLLDAAPQMQTRGPVELSSRTDHGAERVDREERPRSTDNLLRRSAVLWLREDRPKSAGHPCTAA